MARSRRTAAHFASRAGLPEAEGLDRLLNAGIRVKQPKDVIRKSDIFAAELALGLASPRREPDPAPGPKQPPAQVTAAVVEHKQRKKRRAETVKLVGRAQPLSYVSYKDAEAIHWQLVKDFAGSRDPVDPPGIRSDDLLHSAMSRARTSLGAVLKYPTAPMAGAALLHSMVLNHPFHNGNKRTALVSLLVFLDKNNWSLRCAEDDLYDFVLSVASHQVSEETPESSAAEADTEVNDIAAWIHKHITAKNIATRRLKFHDLRSILLKYECEFDHRGSGNRIEITRGSMTAKVWYGGEGREVEPNTVNEIRKRLELDEDHGYDRDLFYNAEERLPEFVIKYRSILERLAKT